MRHIITSYTQNDNSQNNSINPELMAVRTQLLQIKQNLDLTSLVECLTKMKQLTNKVTFRQKAPNNEFLLASYRLAFSLITRYGVKDFLSHQSQQSNINMKALLIDNCRLFYMLGDEFSNGNKKRIAYSFYPYYQLLMSGKAIRGGKGVRS